MVANTQRLRLHQPHKHRWPLSFAAAAHAGPLFCDCERDLHNLHPAAAMPSELIPVTYLRFCIMQLACPLVILVCGAAAMQPAATGEVLED